jgi:putrescine importer
VNGPRRQLSLWDLIFYGIVLIQPIAPVPLYGVAQQLSNGHFATIILIAMFAMLITAVSYGRMAAVHPTAGSAYTYVGKTLNAHLGFVIGWAMFMDYLLQPLINTVWIGTTVSARYTPGVPFIVWAGLVAGILTALNLFGIRSSARANKGLFWVMIAVVVAFFALAVRYLLAGHGGLLSSKPFYNPSTFDIWQIWHATSFAALTYIGFDGITTLAEDAKNPGRNILIATVAVCAFTGVIGCFEVYLGSLVWPNWHAFKDLTSAFMDIASRVGGGWFYNVMFVVLAVAAFGSGLTGSLGAAKLLFGMGRDNVLPKKVFGHLAPGTTTPSYNLLLIGVLTFAGAIALNYYGNAYEHAGEMLNFGAFLAFMGVNVSAFWQFTFARPRGYRPTTVRFVLADVLLPLVGFGFCAWIWWNLNPLAKIVGGIWLVIGVLYVGIKTRGFTQAPVMIDFAAADEGTSPA